MRTQAEQAQNKASNSDTDGVEIGLAGDCELQCVGTKKHNNMSLFPSSTCLAFL